MIKKLFLMLPFLTVVFAQDAKVIWNIQDYQHPTKQVFLQNSVTLLKVELKDKYPTFYVHSKDFKRPIEQNFIKALAKANGYWPFEIRQFCRSRIAAIQKISIRDRQTKSAFTVLDKTTPPSKCALSWDDGASLLFNLSSTKARDAYLRKNSSKLIIRNEGIADLRALPGNDTAYHWYYVGEDYPDRTVVIIRLGVEPYSGFIVERNFLDLTIAPPKYWK
jgi:hypothetical protein